KRKSRIRKNAQRYVKSKDHSLRGRRRQAISRRQVRRHEKHEDEGQDKRSHRALTMKKLESQISQRKKPPKKRHRPIQIVIRNGMQPARPFQQRKIVRDQPKPKQQCRQPSGNLLSRAQETKIE